MKFEELVENMMIDRNTFLMNGNPFEVIEKSIIPIVASNEVLWNSYLSNKNRIRELENIGQDNTRSVASCNRFERGNNSSTITDLSSSLIEKKKVNQFVLVRVTDKGYSPSPVIF